MSHAGDFSPAARAAILERSMGRCAGCGTTTGLTIQHRRARRMGGTSNTAIGHPANGIALCGSGTTGCHGWTEAHPTAAALLGWRLEPGDDPTDVPYWDHVWDSWRCASADGSHAHIDAPRPALLPRPQ